MADLYHFVVEISHAPFIKESIRARGASDIMVPRERGKILKRFENLSQKIIFFDSKKIFKGTNMVPSHAVFYALSTGDSFICR